MSYGAKAFHAYEQGEEFMTPREAAPGRYRAAVIGCGAIGSSIEDDIATAHYRMGLPYGHAPVYATLTRTELVAGADNDAGRRAAFAARWGLAEEQVYPDYREMLASERVDIVSIATPTPLHARMTHDAIDAGVRAIFLEKPLASSVADADRLIAACKEAGIPLSINHTRRGDLHYRKARELIETGAIGDLHSLVANVGGNLMWSASHAFDLLNYLNGDARTRWMMGHLDEPAGFDPGGSAYIVYENGVRAFVNASTGGSIMFRVEAIGTTGTIVIGNYDLELNRSNPGSTRPELIRHPFPQVLPARSPMTVLIDELLDALEGGPTPVSTGDTALQALEQIAALYASSAANNTRIDFPLQDRSLVIRSN
jgi:predicted dehydrogenase